MAASAWLQNLIDKTTMRYLGLFISVNLPIILGIFLKKSKGSELKISKQHILTFQHYRLVRNIKNS